MNLNMHLIMFGSLAIMLVLLATPLIYAEESEEETLLINSSEELPDDEMPFENDSLLTEFEEEEDNETVNGFQMGLKRLGILLTLNQEKKAKKELELANMRLIQARIAAKNGNPKAMENALKAHNRIIERVQNRIDSLEEKSTEEGIKESSERLHGIDRAIEVQGIRVERLKELLEENPELNEEDKTRIEAQIEKAENTSQHLQEVQENRAEKMKIKLMAVGSMSEEEAENQLGIQKREKAFVAGPGMNEEARQRKLEQRGL